MHVVIIGGTSGIGRSMASLYASRGCSVTVVGRALRSTDQRNASAILADLSLRSGQDLVVEQIAKKPIDRLVFTAGWLSSRAQTTREGEDAAWMVHHVARKRIVEAVLPRLPGNAVVGFISGWGSYKKPPAQDYPFGKTDLQGLGHVLKTLMTNEPLFAHFARQRPDLRFLGYHPGPTRNTDLAKRPEAPGFLKLMQPVIRLVGRPVDIVASEFLEAMEQSRPGIFWRKANQELPRPPFLDV